MSAPEPAAPSYASGTSTVPLLGDTIGANLRRTVAAHGDREALVDRGSGRRLDLRRARPTGRGAGPRAARARRRQGRPGRHLGAELRGVGAGAVRHRRDRRDPGQHQPGVPHARAGSTCCSQAGIALLVAAPELQDQRLPGDGRRGPRRLPGPARRWSTSATRTGTALLDRRRRPAAALAERGGRRCPSTTRSTSSTPRAPPASPRARRCRTTTSSTTASSSASLLGYTEAGPDLHPGALLPLLRHGDGQPRGHLARRAAWSSRRPASTRRRPCGRWRTERCTSLYGVPTMFIAELACPDFAAYDLSSAAHRDHGRLAVPGRGDEAGHRRDAHGRGDHLLRHDRDLAGVHPDPGRRRPGPPGRPRSAGCTRTSR